MALIELEFASGESSLSARSFLIEEEMNGLFRAVVMARSADEDLDLDAIVGQPAALRITSDLRFTLHDTRIFSGICCSLEQVQAISSEAGLCTYEIIIVPSLFKLTQRITSRLHQHVSIPDILERLLAEWAIEPVFWIDRDRYPKLEQRVQYDESDYAFFCRLCEEAGISFFFVGDREAGSQLVLCDSPHGRDARLGPPLPFVEEISQVQSAGIEYVTAIRIGHEVRPGRVTIRDFDFRRPRLALFGDSPRAAAPEDHYEQYSYEQGAFLHELGEGKGASEAATPTADDKGTARFDEEVGSVRAKLRLEGLRASRRRVCFESNALDLCPGTVFSMIGHPRRDLLPDRQMLVVSSSIEGSVDGEWLVKAQALFTSEPYRPPCKTPKPRIWGRQSAIVVGPEGEEIYADEFGRVRVQFHWDREGRFDPDSSMWMRVSQGFAGAGYGMMVLPRVGHEVLVGFLDGDPDSPVIVGRAFNGENQVPYKLPEHKTVSTWKSCSSPGGDGYSEIKFEDKAGEELFYCQAQRDFAELVKRSRTATVGNDRTEIIGHDEMSSIHSRRTKLVNRDERIAIGNCRTQQLRYNHHLSVGRNRTSFVRNDEMETAAESRFSQTGLNRHTTVGRKNEVRVGVRYSVSVAQGLWGKMARTLSEAQQNTGFARMFKTRAPLLYGPLSAVWGGPFAPLLREGIALDLERGQPTEPEARARAVIDALPAPIRTVASVMDQAFRDLMKKLDVDEPSTRLELIDKEISFSTGHGAKLVLNGPDIALIAEGTITLHAGQNLSLTSGKSALVAQGGPNVAINPRSRPSSAPKEVSAEVALDLDEVLRPRVDAKLPSNLDPALLSDEELAQAIHEVASQRVPDLASLSMLLSERLFSRVVGSVVPPAELPPQLQWLMEAGRLVRPILSRANEQLGDFLGRNTRYLARPGALPNPHLVGPYLSVLSSAGIKAPEALFRVEEMYRQIGDMIEDVRVFFDGGTEPLNSLVSFAPAMLERFSNLKFATKISVSPEQDEEKKGD